MARVQTVSRALGKPAARVASAGPSARYGRGRARYQPGRDSRRKRVYLRDKGLCQQCLANGVTTPLALHSKDKERVAWCDHYIPLAQGGEDTERNQWILCKRCHDAKSVEDSQGVWREPRDFGAPDPAIA